MKNAIVSIIRDPNFLIFQVAELEKPATERSKRRDEKAGATYIKLGARGRLQDEFLKHDEQAVRTARQLR